MSASANDIKMVDPEDNVGSGQQETSFYNANDTDAFLPPSSKPKTAEEESSGDSSKFTGLTREELEQYAKDPKWVKIRWVLLIILVIGWAGLLIAAIVIVVVEPKCPPTPNLEWYQDGVAYKVDVPRFQDTDGDGIGDIAGVQEHLDHFTDLGIKSVWLDNAVIDENFTNLTADFKGKDIRVVVQLDMLADVSDMEELVIGYTDAGAGGFVVSRANMSEEEYASVTTRLQQEVLDKEYNKIDDRARVIIGDSDVTGSISSNLSAVVYESPVDCADLTDWQCTVQTLKAYGEANVNSTLNAVKKGSAPADPWKIPQAVPYTDKAECALALKLTLPGTPNVMSGDEIGLPSGDNMKWDDSESGGFTANEDYVYPQSNGVASVLAQKSVGYTGSSVYTLFKNLVAVRSEEPSLKWGDLQWIDFGDDVVTFVRTAEAVPPVVVAINSEEDRAGSLVYGEYSQAEVLIASGIDVSVGDTIDLEAVYLPADSVLVARMSIPPADK